MTKVLTIDCDYLHPKFAAAYLLIDGGRAAFIENNTSHATPKLMRALEAEGLSGKDVDYLIVTHAHLDHAGGTSALLKHCPGAQVLAHPKAAKTLIDPTRLIASAKKVYGDSEFAKLYGEILPISAARVREMGDGETLEFGQRKLSFLFTKGHATHHFCVYDSYTNGIFTGDAFGLRYPVLQDRGLFIFPSTSPIDFDPAEARISLDKILGTGADRAYLTHFGELGGLAEARTQLLEHLDAHARTLEEAKGSELEGKELVAFCETRLREHFTKYFQKRGWAESAERWKWLKLDLEINAAGIAFVARRVPRS